MSFTEPVVVSIGSAPVYSLEVNPNLSRENPVSGFVADVAEGLRAIQARLRIRDHIGTPVIG